MVGHAEGTRWVVLRSWSGGWAACLALLMLLMGPPATAEPDDASWRRTLQHPLAAQREAAARAVLDAGEDGRRFACSLVDDPASCLRTAAWQILRQRPGWIDLERCRQALGDDDAQVGVAAAGALLALAMSDERVPVVLLPAGQLHKRRAATRALASALAPALEVAEAGRVASVGLRLGEGAMPALVAVGSSERYHRDVRSSALAVVARINSEASRDQLLALTEPGVLTDRSALLSALLQTPLDESQRKVMYLNLHAAASNPRFTRRSWGRWRSFFRPRQGGWREYGRLRQLVRTHPPVEGCDDLISYLEQRLRSRRRHPSEVIDSVAALAAIDGIDEEIVRLVVTECLETGWHPRWKGRAEELGNVLVTLHRFDAFEDVLRAELADLFAVREVDLEDEATDPTGWTTNLPRSVEAWGHYILGSDPEMVRRMATVLIRGDGEMPSWSARRLGVQLWRELGTPPMDVVRPLFSDGDAWMRRAAMNWLGAIPEDERSALVDAALRDEEDAVFLAATRLAAPKPIVAHLRRLLRLAVEGSRGDQRRAFAELARRAPAPAGGVSTTAPPDGASLDLRLAAAGRFRAVFGLDKGLPGGAGR